MDKPSMLDSALAENSNKAMINKIKTCLSSNNWFIGLFILKKYTLQVDEELFCNNVVFWMQNLNKIIEQSTDQKERKLCFLVTSQILLRISKLTIPIVTRELSLCIVPTLIKQLMKCPTNETLDYCHCLKYLAFEFPTPVAQNRNKIQTKLIETVNQYSKFKSCVKSCIILGDVYATICLVGPSLSNKWTGLISILMETLLKYTNDPFFSSLEKPPSVFIFEKSELLKNFSFNPPKDETDNPQVVINKICFIGAALQTAIVSQYPTKFALPIEGIIEVLTNVMICAINTKKAVYHLTISSMFIEMICRVLMALVQCCGSNILIYSRLINHIVTTSITWLRGVDKQHTHEAHFGLCKFLSAYLQTIGINLCFSKMEFIMIVQWIFENLRWLDSRYNCPVLACNTIQLIRMIIKNHNGLLDKNIISNIYTKVLITLIEIYKSWFNLKLPQNFGNLRKELTITLQEIVLNVPNETDIPLESITVILNEIIILENDSSVRTEAEKLRSLVNFVLLSRIPIRNDQFQDKDKVCHQATQTINEINEESMNIRDDHHWSMGSSLVINKRKTCEQPESDESVKHLKTNLDSENSIPIPQTSKTLEDVSHQPEIKNPSETSSSNILVSDGAKDIIELLDIED